MTSIDIRITRLPHGDDLPLPSYQSALAAGMDLLAAVPADAPLTLAPGVRALVPTGIAIALPVAPQTDDRLGGPLARASGPLYAASDLAGWGAPGQGWMMRRRARGLRAAKSRWRLAKERGVLACRCSQR